MKSGKLRRVREPKLMIIPMIDIIFFLLVFFMMSTLYMVEQKTIPVQLPQASTQQITTENTIPITALPNGKIMFEQEELPPELLARRIQAALALNEKSVFVLRADQATEYRYVVIIIDELKKAGAKHFAIATERKVAEH
ncbi:MAG: biopolymer transporter ExbD [Sporomusaceae bacterium]|jgi:biopolymer transport protein ExbD|nr:biopolymer transporter ExbD [Sporomusaceae bacterium]